MKKAFLGLTLVLIISASFARAQTAEVTISLNEQFFDALIEAIFKNSNPPEFPIAATRDAGGETNAFIKASSVSSASCPETIRLQREIDGVKTAVRFRDGQILAPLSFTGNYNPPLIGCVDFSGVAQTNIVLEFDRERQALVGRAKVLSVDLSGAGGVGSGIIANLVQGSIDRKVNPIEILRLDKISFVVPIQNSGALKMKAVGIKTDVGNGVLNVRIVYRFEKA
jgi:hypothetical protein